MWTSVQGPRGKPPRKRSRSGGSDPPAADRTQRPESGTPGRPGLLHVSGDTGGRGGAQPRGCSLTTIGGHAFSHGRGVSGEVGRVRGGGRGVRSRRTLLAWGASGRRGISSQSGWGEPGGGRGHGGRRSEAGRKPGTGAPSQCQLLPTPSPAQTLRPRLLSWGDPPHHDAAPSSWVPSQHWRGPQGLHFPGGVGGSVVKGPRAEPGCEQGHPPNPGGSAPHPRTAGRDPQRHSADPQEGANPPPQHLCQGRPGLRKQEACGQGRLQ